MNWHLYRKDDPNTWPNIDCPILVCVDDAYYHNFLMLSYWDNIRNEFVDTVFCENISVDECYYQYIGYIPNGYKAFKTTKCNIDPEYGCEYECDGYCFDAPEEILCEHCKEVTEYSLNDTKRIWKEFE